MEPCVERLGLLNGSVTTLQRQKDLFELVSPELIFPLHLYLMELAREVCVLEETLVDCPNCALRSRCPSSTSFRRKSDRVSKASSRKNGASRGMAAKSSRTRRRGP